MTTDVPSALVVIKRHSLSLSLALLLATILLLHPGHASDPYGAKASLDIVHLSLLKGALAADISLEDSKKGKHPRYPGAPPGLHYLPMFAMFFFVMLIVVEKDGKSREMLFLPVLFSFLIYKVLFLIEENAAIDSYLRKK